MNIIIINNNNNNNNNNINNNNNNDDDDDDNNSSSSNNNNNNNNNSLFACYGLLVFVSRVVLSVCFIIGFFVMVPSKWTLLTIFAPFL